jgi:MoaA/NifB/PqqE/SkfB family radical SAM enzyme
MKILRNELMNGIKSEGCHSCWDMEKSEVTSTRQKAIVNWPSITYDILKDSQQNNFTVDIVSLKSIEVRFDNACNLMCRHCSPQYSTKWETAVKKDVGLYNELYGYNMVKDITKPAVSLTDDVILEVEKFAHHLEEILITGGEPLYHEKHYAFLEKILPWAQNITLNYNSNLSVLKYKNKSIIPLWKKFKKVSVLVSIDATRDTYEYVRVHGNISRVEKNILELMNNLDNIHIQATCTTSLLNITKFVDIMKYFLTLKVGVHTSLVQYPESLNIKLLPNELKKTVTQDWEQFKLNLVDIVKETYTDTSYINFYTKRVALVGDGIISYMNSEDRSDKWKNFKNYIAAQDKFHNTDILKYYPEYEEYLNV